MQCLNKYKEMEFVQNAKILTLSMDENWTEFRKNNVMGWILQKEKTPENICFILYYFVFPRELISHLWILIPGGLERGVKNNNCNFKWP